jgi:alpha-tubulin suppressor-like RCC1 family protein
VPIAKLPSDVVALQAGGSSSAAICADGRLFVWGRNDHGALGIGHDSSKWAPTHVPGFIAVHPGECVLRGRGGEGTRDGDATPCMWLTPP